MDSLTKGFCSDILTGSLPNGISETWTSRWPSPTLQIVDIQRYPKLILESSVVSRFYIAVSDSLSLLWLVIPPGSEMEELVHTFQIEIGCCITLKDYKVVNAKNGLNVIVPISFSYSGTALSLLGNPVFEPALFNLSRESLTKRRGSIKFGTFQISGEILTLNLTDIVEMRGQNRGDYAINLRIIWKSKERHLSGSKSITNFIFDCIGVDTNGDSIFINFIGSSTFYEIFSLGDCIRATNGNLILKNELQESIRLQFDERSSDIQCIAETDNIIPKYPYRMFGSKTVKEILDYNNIGDIISVEGIVIKIYPPVFTSTKRGQVERAGIVLKDFKNSSFIIDITLWDDICKNVKPTIGSRWCFCGFVVREYMQKLTLSSRYLSIAFEMKLDSNIISSQNEIIRLNEKIDKELLQVVLGLDEASETLPVLAKIQRVRIPLTYMVCYNCNKPINDKISSCNLCNSSNLEKRILLRLDISDGISSISAIGFAQIAEILLGSDTLIKLKNENILPNMERDIANELVGIPLLFWLLRSPEGLMHIVNCKLIEMSKCASTLLGAVEQMMEIN